MIKLTHISKTFGENSAVCDISFTAKRGEIIGFLGPNGAGKTTTMRMILGLVKPTSGSIDIDSYDPISNRLKVLPTIGYLPENNPLYEDMKVWEYLSFISGAKGADIHTLKNILTSVDLADKQSARISDLSRGYRQRVGLAAALVGDPRILILDEPTSGLDPIEQEKIKKFIKKIAKKKIIIFSTHILSEVEDVANKLVIINLGKIVYDGAKPKRKGGVATLFKKLVT